MGTQKLMGIKEFLNKLDNYSISLKIRSFLRKKFEKESLKAENEPEKEIAQNNKKISLIPIIISSLSLGALIGGLLSFYILKQKIDELNKKYTELTQKMINPNKEKVNQNLSLNKSFTYSTNLAPPNIVDRDIFKSFYLEELAKNYPNLIESGNKESKKEEQKPAPQLPPLSSLIKENQNSNNYQDLENQKKQTAPPNIPITSVICKLDENGKNDCFGYSPNGRIYKDGAIAPGENGGLYKLVINPLGTAYWEKIK